MTKEKVTAIGDPTLDYLFDDVKDNSSSKNFKLIMDSVNFPETGKIVSATLEGTTKNHYLFNFNSKDYIHVEKSNVENIFLQNVEVGETANLLITNIKEKPFTINGSVARMYESKNKSREDFEDVEDVEVEVYIKEIIPAGYNVTMTLNGVATQAFMPHTLAGINKLTEPEKIIGSTLTAMIESFDEEKRTFVVSRKRYLRNKEREERKNLVIMDKVYTGRVTGTTEYGVFVEFEGYHSAMIHITNLHSDWRDKIKEIPNGMEIVFYIKDVTDSKIFATQYNVRSVWDTGKVGDIYDATVIDVKANGILVALDDETKGMVSATDAVKAKDTIGAGDVIRVKITGINKEKRKIFLLLAQ